MTDATAPDVTTWARQQADTAPPLTQEQVAALRRVFGASEAERKTA